MAKKTKPAWPKKIKIISHRNRLIDVDNLCVKFFIDGLVTAGLLPDDSPEYVSEVIVSQKQSKVEKPIIEII